MEKKDFHENMRYTLTLTMDDKLRALNVYVMKLHGDSMIVRITEKEGILKKIPYANVHKIVKFAEVAAQDQFHVPQAMLTEKNWEGRSEMQHYSSASHMGK